MKLQLPHNATITVDDNSTAVYRVFKGLNKVIIDNTWMMDFSKWNYDQFCKDASYCDYYEGEVNSLIAEIRVTPIHSLESLLAYCHYYKFKWENINEKIEWHKKTIAELELLKS